MTGLWLNDSLIMIYFVNNNGTLLSRCGMKNTHEYEWGENPTKKSF